jgi:hypothetical protein
MYSLQKSCARFSENNLQNNVTWMARVLLGKGPANMPRLNTHKETTEESPFLCNDLLTTFS